MLNLAQLISQSINLVLALLLLLVLGECGKLALTAYNLTTVPSSLRVTIDCYYYHHLFTTLKCPELPR